jgi:competence protein ComEA
MLVVITVVTILAGWVAYEQWIYAPPPPDLSAMEPELEEWLARRNEGPPADTIPVATLFPFDPNTLMASEWQQFGLTERQASGIMRFTEKGGVFRTKKDVERMYTVTPEMFARLEPFILLPDSLPPRPERRSQYSERETRQGGGPPRRDTLFERREPAAWKERPVERAPVKPLDVNLADTTELVQLPGIGPAFARGIVKYRESLGGYVSMDQLAEVYVLRDKPEALERIRELLYLEHGAVRKIPLNQATPEELAAHPYISWKVAHGVVNYRKQHGPFNSVEAIKGSVLVNDSLYERLHPYLSVDP